MTPIPCHFHPIEFRCPCCNFVPAIDPAFIAALETLRVAIGNKPILITSGYRCPGHNAAVGGVPNSWHTRQPLQAADITVPGMDPADVYVEALELFRGTGLSIIENFVHVDLRPYPTHWTY